MMNVKFGKKNREAVYSDESFAKYVSVMRDAEKQFKDSLQCADYEASKRHIRELQTISESITNSESKAKLDKYISIVIEELYEKYPNGSLVGYCPDGLAGVLEEGSEYAAKNGFYYTPSGREEFTWKDNFVDAGCVVDIEVVSELWSLCSKIILNFKAMFIPEISECVGLLKKLTTAENVSKGVKGKVIKYAKKFKEYFSDEAFLEFFGNNIDLKYFIKEDSIDNDALLQYLRTYKQLYRDLGLDFTKTKLWDMYITAEMLDLFEEDEDITRWRKDYFEYSDSDNYDDEYDWEGVGDEDYYEEEEVED